MYSGKSFGPRMEPWWTLALIEYSCKDFPCRTTWSHLLLRTEEIKTKYLTWNSIRHKFVKKTSMPNPVKNLGYIKWYSLSSPSSVKRPNNSVRYNSQKICSWLRRPKTIQKSEKRPHFSRWSTSLLFTSFSKTLLMTERRVTRQ